MNASIALKYLSTVINVMQTNTEKHCACNVMKDTISTKLSLCAIHAVKNLKTA